MEVKSRSSADTDLLCLRNWNAGFSSIPSEVHSVPSKESEVLRIPPGSTTVSLQVQHSQERFLAHFINQGGASNYRRTRPCWEPNRIPATD
jgi:hypothetical protein